MLTKASLEQQLELFTLCSSTHLSPWHVVDAQHNPAELMEIMLPVPGAPVFHMTALPCPHIQNMGGALESSKHSQA